MVEPGDSDDAEVEVLRNGAGECVGFVTSEDLSGMSDEEKNKVLGFPPGWKPLSERNRNDG